MSFADPVVLLGLLALPLLVIWYSAQQRRRVLAAAAFTTPAMAPSVTPRRPRWRRHAPMLAFLLALALLILAAARPQRSVAEPVTNGAVMLANDVSDSMNATDVAPSREGAARRAAKRFVASVPGTVEVGLLAFARKPIVLQSPSSDHALTQTALEHLPHTSGGTAVGEAILTAMHELQSVPRVAGRRPPGAVVLISDGTSNVGVGPIVAAHEAAAAHIPIYTISVGTAHGTITVTQGGKTVTGPVPVSRQQLAEIAIISGGRAFAASDSAGVDVAYQRLAAKLGRKQVTKEITASVAGGGLVLLLLGSVLSLIWFGRLV
ncbi:MAG: VWA domain-containing protein [Solirubrobacteraceae bacterium]